MQLMGKRVSAMKRCTDYKALIGAHADGTATEAEIAELRAHLTECAACAREVRELAQVRKLVKGLPTLRLPQGLMPAVSARLREQRITWFDRLFGGMRPAELRLAAAVVMVLIVAVVGVGYVTVHGLAPGGPAVQPAPSALQPPPNVARAMPTYTAPAAAAPAAPTDEYLQACNLAHGTLDQDQAYWGAEAVQLATYVR